MAHKSAPMTRFESQVYSTVSQLSPPSYRQIKVQAQSRFIFLSSHLIFDSELTFLHPTGIEHISSSGFSIYSKHTLTGLKLMVVVSTGFPSRAAQDILTIIYANYTDFVLKDPFYALDMPIRCSLFDKAVRQILAV